MAYPDIAQAAIAGIEGVALNPAALSLNREIAIAYYHSFAEGDLSGDNGLLFSNSGLGVGYQRLTLGYPALVSRYDFSVSAKLLRNLYSGLSYTYYKSDWEAIDRAHSWNYSLLFHPISQLSFSAQVQNINRHPFSGAESSVGYLLSTASRPFGDKLTIGGNLRLYGGQKIADAERRLVVRVSPYRGLAVFGGWGNKNSFSIGIELQLGKVYGGGSSFFGSPGGYSKSTLYVGSTTAEKERLLPGKKKILHLGLSGEIPEASKASFPFFRKKETMLEKLQKVEAARNDRSVQGLLLTVANPEIGWGKLSALRQSLLRFRESGKRVVCYLGVTPGNGSFFLASAADSVFMIPVDALNLTGMRAEVTFYKGLLEKLAVEPQIEKTGKYKNAPNVYTEDSLVPEHREAVESLLDDLYEQFVRAIASGRDMSESQVRTLIDAGPFTSIQAESLRLIDGRFYPGEMTERLPQLFDGIGERVASDQYLPHHRFREDFCEPPQVAIIPITGGIRSGSSGFSPLSGEESGSATICALVQRARDDPAVKALVVRIDSPGGEAIASDLIWGELQKARRRKPVVVSMSDVCASGGYYIASASDEIFVEQTTITGSIGVYAGKANLAGLYEKLGARTEIVSRGKHADMYSWKSSYSDEERSILRRQVDDMYNRFLSVVSDGRNLSRDSVNAIAQGRVWSGSQALRIGLADKEGSITEAVREAARLARIDDQPYEQVMLSPRRTWIGDSPALIATLLSMFDHIDGSDGISLTGLNLGEPSSLLARIPYRINIE